MTLRDGTKTRGQRGHSSKDDDQTSGAKYRELLSIGSGGSANISIAVAEGLAGFSKLVVLKTIREELVANGAAKTMFLDEARLSARMNHPNVVQVYEVFLRQEVPVIVMEFLDGQPLSAILAQASDRHALTLEVTISILSKVLAGLHYAHTLTDFSGEPLGLIHRDVSPHNVMVTYDGQVKLVDFGIAKLAGAEHQTRTGVIKGKLTYMAPEQFTGKVDCRADIFGVGVMLWELATRQRFWGDLPEPALIGRLISGDLPHLRRPGAMDDELYRICCRSLAFMPDERYENAGAMLEDLEHYLARRGAVVTQLAIGRLVTETCAEARQKVQSGIRQQLSQHGLSLTGAVEGSSRERVRPQLEPRDTLSGKRVRKNEPRDSSTGGLHTRIGAEPTTGGLRAGGSAPPRTPGYRAPSGTDDSTTGGLRRRLGQEPTTSGGLRPRASAGLGHTSTGERLERQASTAPREPQGALAESRTSTEAAPLRLFGGVAPTARAGVALAGFGTLGVLILALGLATPEEEPKGTVQAASSGPSAAPGQSPEAQRARVVRITASAQPAEASWYLDDQKLDENPLEFSVPVDGAMHTLRAEAPGYAPFIKSVRLDTDVDVTVALAPQ
jgi:serine/threonine protein kinase